MTHKARKYYATRLDTFLVREHVNPAELARRSGVSRRTLVRIRSGNDRASDKTIILLVLTLRELLHKPIQATDLFDLGDDAHPGDPPQ